MNPWREAWLEMRVIVGLWMLRYVVGRVLPKPVAQAMFQRLIPWTTALTMNVPLEKTVAVNSQRIPWRTKFPPKPSVH